MPDEPMRLEQLQSGRDVRLLSVVGVREGDQVGIRRMPRNVRVVSLASVGHRGGSLVSIHASFKQASLYSGEKQETGDSNRSGAELRERADRRSASTQAVRVTWPSIESRYALRACLIS
jgi:hypothetical protein